MALRYMCGGDPYDIGLAHGVHPNEVKKSCWIVVDAVNGTGSLDIQYPVCHEDQLDVAKGFKAKSTIGLWNCAGAIDGMLVWISKPSKSDVEENIGFGEGRFLCGRKGKFGIQLQAICDSKRRFLDVSIGTPGSSSDYFTFLHVDSGVRSTAGWQNSKHGTTSVPPTLYTPPGRKLDSYSLLNSAGKERWGELLKHVKKDRAADQGNQAEKRMLQRIQRHHGLL